MPVALNIWKALTKPLTWYRERQKAGTLLFKTPLTGTDDIPLQVIETTGRVKSRHLTSPEEYKECLDWFITNCPKSCVIETSEGMYNHAHIAQAQHYNYNITYDPFVDPHLAAYLWIPDKQERMLFKLVWG